MKTLNEIGINNSPCHQDLYSGNFILHKDTTFLIDWEYSSMGDYYFDFADLFWQNEFDLDINLRNDALHEIGISKKDEVEKFENFEILSIVLSTHLLLSSDEKSESTQLEIFSFVLFSNIFDGLETPTLTLL